MNADRIDLGDKQYGIRVNEQSVLCRLKTAGYTFLADGI